MLPKDKKRAKTHSSNENYSTNQASRTLRIRRSRAINIDATRKFVHANHHRPFYKTKFNAVPDLKAKTTAKILSKFMYTYGIPEQILTDQGRDYESALIAELMDLFDIHKIRTSPYHPQADGLSERMVQTSKI